MAAVLPSRPVATYARIGEPFVEILGGSEDARFLLESADQNTPQKTTPALATLPAVHVQILPHQEFAKGEKGELDGVRTDSPPVSRAHGGVDAPEVLGRKPFVSLGEVRQRQAEVGRQERAEREVRLQVLVPEDKSEPAAGAVALQIDEKEDQRSEPLDAGRIALVPAQEPQGEEEDADALLLLEGLGVPVEGQSVFWSRSAVSRVCSFLSLCRLATAVPAATSSVGRKTDSSSSSRASPGPPPWD